MSLSNNLVKLNSKHINGLYVKLTKSKVLSNGIFIQNFDCTVVTDTTIPESSLQDTLKALEVIRTRDSKHLRNYYNMALENRNIYAKLSYINQIVYNEPLRLIQSKNQRQKQYYKELDKNVA